MGQLFLRVNRDIKLTGSVKSQVENRVFKGFSRAALKIEQRVRKLIINRMGQDPVLHSLVEGTLRWDFGLTGEAASAAVSTIKQFILDHLEVSVRKSRGSDFSNLELDWSPDLKELSQLPIASYTSEGGDVPWLYWLLFRGSTVINEEYEAVWTAEYLPKLRSGRAYMSKGGVFRVDPRFSGTEFSNFITDIMEDLEKQIVQIFRDELTKKRTFK
jgi:hypothetical protein